MIEAGQLPTLSTRASLQTKGAADAKADVASATGSSSGCKLGRTDPRRCRRIQVPRKSASWFYVFGSAALTVFMLQIFTGIMLALIYVPSAGEAWNSLQYPQSQRHPGLVPARRARLGLELHGRHCAHPHGARSSCSAPTSFRAN